MALGRTVAGKAAPTPRRETAMRPFLRLSALAMLSALLTGPAMGPALAATTFTAGYQYQMAVPGVSDANSWSGAVRPDSPLFYLQGLAVPDGLPATGWAELGGGGLTTYGQVVSASFGFTGMATRYPNQSTYLHAESTNAMSDSFVINCAACTAGSIGNLSFRVYWGGIGVRELSTVSPGTALSGYVADINWSTNFQMHADGVPDPFPPDQPAPPNPGRLGMDYYFLETERNGVRHVEESPRVSAGLQELSIQFVFGQPIHVDMSLRAAVLGGVFSGEDQTSTFQSNVDLVSAYGKMYWDGITGVSTADGQQVDAFTAFNNVGVDYARSLEVPILQVVPEPGAWALMLGGLAALGALARRRKSALLLAAGLSLAGANVSAADFTAGAGVSGNTATKSDQRSSGDLSGTSPIAGSASISLTDAVSGVSQDVTASALARASYGHLSLAARAQTLQQSTGAQPGAHAEASASASLTDSFIIRCDTCVDGTRGTMSLRALVLGDVGLSNASTDAGGQPNPDGGVRTTQYYWSTSLSMRAEGVAMDFPGPGTLALNAYDFLAKVNDTVVAGGNREGTGVYDFQLEFEFGRPIHLEWLASVSASADLRPEAATGGSLAAASFADFSHSFAWDGIGSVVDAAGNVVTGFTALNSDGIDYARSLAVVPEPSTWGLMAAGRAAGRVRARPRAPLARVTPRGHRGRADAGARGGRRGRGGVLRRRRCLRPDGDEEQPGHAQPGGRVPADRQLGDV